MFVLKFGRAGAKYFDRLSNQTGAVRLSVPISARGGGGFPLQSFTRYFFKFEIYVPFCGKLRQGLQRKAPTLFFCVGLAA